MQQRLTQYNEDRCQICFCFLSEHTKRNVTIFTLNGNPQTTNENNQFALRVVEACEMAAMKYGNSVLLNESTDGVSCELQFNKTINISYLDSGKKYLSMTD